MTVNTRFIYTPIENGRRRTGGWSQTRAWQERGDGQEAKRAVMVHEMRATDKKLDLLVARIFDEARRIFFKVSNLPEAGRSTPCLERHYKQTQEDGNVYHIITKGWHGNTLGDLFGENGSLKAIGTSFRAEFRRPGRRAEFWQALTPIVKLLQHMQEAKLFLPGLDLDSLCFCADDENEYLEQQAGHFSFDSLRLVGLERILPFGTRLGNAHLDAASPMNMAPVQILTWRSLAGVIIDALLGPPPAAWSDEKKT